MDKPDANGAERTYTATAADVAEKYGKHPRSVLRWCETTDIPHRRTPGGPRFNLDEVDEWMKPEPVA